MSQNDLPTKGDAINDLVEFIKKIYKSTIKFVWREN